MLNYSILLYILIFTGRCLGHNLDIVVSEILFFRSCDNPKIMNIEDFVQVNLTQDYADDMETLIINGNVTFLNSLRKDGLIQVHLNVFKWERGNWQNTIFSIRRNNICLTLFSPLEPWYSMIKSVPMEDRICPPVKGTVYNFNNMEATIRLNDVNFSTEGKLKLLIRIKTTAFVTCHTVFADVWRN